MGAGGEPYCVNGLDAKINSATNEEGIFWGDAVADFYRTNLTAGEILGEAIALIQRNLLLCAIGALIMFAVKTGSDLGVRQWLLAGSVKARLAGLPYFLVIAVIHYLLITRLMQAEGIANGGWSAGALLRFFSAYFLVAIGMILGLILLIIPGFILMIRWTIYANFIIGQGLRPVSSIKASWEATRGSGGAIFVAILVMGLAAAPGVFLTRGGFAAEAVMSTATVITGDLYAAVLGMVGLCITTSIYLLLVGPDHTRLTDIFA